jgi:hypothetical protein|eukprot:m.437930 g.437930  ORF g.437930 m.437930 type:complete len:58 (+) comp112581_c0_seq1:251-424(+)
MLLLWCQRYVTTVTRYHDIWTSFFGRKFGVTFEQTRKENIASAETVRDNGDAQDRLT